MCILLLLERVYCLLHIGVILICSFLHETATFVFSHGVPSLMLFISCGLVHVTISLLSPFYIRVCRYMRRLTTGCRSEECVIRRFRCCAKIIECTYTNVDNMVWPTTHLGYKV